MGKMKVKYDVDSYSEFTDRGKAARAESVTVTCRCGNSQLEVNFIPAPYTGAYLKTTCPKCGANQVLYDDYS
jgi:hypothetical protein